MNEKPKKHFDCEKEFQYCRDMANSLNHKSINTLIALSTGAIVLSPKLYEIYFADSNSMINLFKWGIAFLVLSLILGIIQIMYLHIFWEKLANYYNKHTKGENQDKVEEDNNPKVHSADFCQYGQFVTFIFGIVMLFLIVVFH